jgi:hypothetical protein
MNPAATIRARRPASNPQVTIFPTPHLKLRPIGLPLELDDMLDGQAIVTELRLSLFP